MKAANWRKAGWDAFAAAMLIAGAVIPMAANAENIEVTTNGVTWRFTIPAPGGAAGTAMIGVNTAVNGAENRDNKNIKAIAATGLSVNAASIPWQFDYEGSHYTVTMIGLGAFRYQNDSNSSKLYGTLTIPDSVTEVRNHAFNNQTTLEGFVGGRNVQRWGSGTAGGGIFASCSSMAGTYPDMSQATLFGDSIFSGTAKLIGTLKFGNQLTRIDNYAFQSSQIAGAVVIPASVDTLGNNMAANYNYGVFWKCANLEALWIKGKPTAAEQTYTTVYAASLVRECPAMKIVLIGRNTKGASMNGSAVNQRMLYGVSNVPVLVPANGYWDGLDAGGTNNRIWLYGEGEEFNLSIDDEAMTASITPATVNALTNALVWAKDFKTHFNLDTYISVTNELDMTDTRVPEDAAQGATFDRLVFSVTSQAQLQGLLDAFPASVPFGVDPVGLKGTLVVPSGRGLYVKSREEYVIKKNQNTFVINVK